MNKNLLHYIALISTLIFAYVVGIYFLFVQPAPIIHLESNICEGPGRLIEEYRSVGMFSNRVYTTCMWADLPKETVCSDAKHLLETNIDKDGVLTCRWVREI